MPKAGILGLWMLLGLVPGRPAAAGEPAPLVQVPDLHVVGWTIDDSDPLGGNDDGGLGPGETALLSVTLSNRGNQAARGVVGQLFEVGDHPDIVILDKLAVWPDLPATGVPAASVTPHFELQIAVTRPCRWSIPLRLELTADGGYSATREFVVELVDPHDTDLAVGAGRPAIYGVESDDSLGRTVAAGDLDGDGFDDLVIGSPLDDGPGNARLNAGAVRIVYGAPTRPADLDLAALPLDTAVIYGAETGDFIGGAVATGDLDGDGFDEVIVGGEGGDGPGNARSFAGDVIIVWGAAGRLTVLDLGSSPAGVSYVYGATSNDRCGLSVATGDADGNGYDDLLLGCFFGDGPADARLDAGEAGLLYGGPTRPATVDLAAPSLDVSFVFGRRAGDTLGRVAMGDLDGDGFDDLICGSSAADGPGNTRSLAGEAAIVYGGAARLPSVDLAASSPGVALVYGANAGDLYGAAAATGDLDGDGFDDLILGAPGGDGPGNTRAEAGEVAIVYGGATRLASVDLAAVPAGIAFLYGADPGDDLGQTVVAADFDGDGYDDVVAGAYFADGPGNLRTNAGEAAVVWGRGARPDSIDLAARPADVLRIYGVDFDDSLGEAIGAGDFDGDGLDEIVLGVPRGDGPGNARPFSAGEVIVLPGEPRTRYRHDSASFGFIDATGGANLGLACDDCSATIPIGFEFDFFGRKVSEVMVSSNGYLTFGGPGDRLPTFCPPRSGLPNAMIAALWDDLDPSAGGAVYALLEGVAPNRRLTVEWAGVPLYGAAGAATFEATLFESSDRIVMQYQDVDFGVPGSNDGGTAIVGVENATGRVGATYSCFTPAVVGGSAVAWRRFASPATILAHDVESGTGGFTATGLWHRERSSVSSCAPASRSGDWSWYYGQPSTCDYDTTGVANSGSLTAPLVTALPQDARLGFWQRRETEGGNSFDLSKVEVQADGGGFVEIAEVLDVSSAWKFSGDLLLPDPSAGVFSSLDLSAFTGQDVEVRFSFDTGDEQFNGFLGWMIDDVALQACPVFGGGGFAAAVEARATGSPLAVCEDGGARVDAVGSFCTACPVELTYQWAEEGLPIGGATDVTYDIAAGHAPGTVHYTVAVACPGRPGCAAESDPVPIDVVARPVAVEATLMLSRDGADLTFTWVDVPGAADYVVLSGSDAAMPLGDLTGAAASGGGGLTVPLPPADLVFFRVAGRNPVCGVGPLQ